MEIICPECQFAREVDESKIPAKSQVATCPKCQTKFRFRELPSEEAPVASPEPAPEPIAPQTPETAPSEPDQSSGLRQGSLLAHTEPKKSEPQRQEQRPEQLPEQRPEQTPPAPQPEETTPERPAFLKKIKPAQETEEEQEPTFPNIPAPGEENREGLWDKLDSMTPPEEQPQQVQAPSQTQQPEIEEEQTYTQPPASGDQQPIPGWTGEFNDDFPDPMQGDQHDEEEDEHGPNVPPPFEQLDRYGFFHGLFMTIKLILLSPRLFFSVMPVGGGLAKPLTFTILLTMIQGFVQYFWAMAGLSTSVGPDGGEALGGVSGALAPLLMLLFMPAFIAAGQFMITGMYHILLKLMRADSQGFEGTFRALTYANAPIILGLFPMPIPEVEIVWMAITAIWGLFLTIIGLKHIHKSSYAKVVPVCLIPLLLGMIAALAVFQQQFPTI